jgi:hypothetical protein
MYLFSVSFEIPAPILEFMSSKSDEEPYAIGSRLVFEKIYFFRRFFKNVKGVCKVLCK